MTKKITYWIRNYFGFSKIETNGFIGLLVVVVLVLLAPLFYDFLDTSTYSASTNDKLMLDSLVHQLEQKNADLSKASSVATLNPFPFNPNEEGLEVFLQLGLSNNIGQRIINYRKAGGSFKIKSDFRKIYGLSQEKYDQLYPYLQLPERLTPAHTDQHKTTPTTFTKAGTPKNKTVAKRITNFDINTCDTATLKKIYGIGPVLAERIIKYRSLLGGFVVKEQLSEVYGLKGEALENIYGKSYIEETFVPEKVTINESDVKAMASHPYISFPLAKAIYAYRAQHGNFSTPEALLNIHIVDSATLIKLKPYIAL